MDDATPRSLIEALAATPGNSALRMAVIRSLHPAGNPEAAKYVEKLSPGAGRQALFRKMLERDLEKVTLNPDY